MNRRSCKHYFPCAGLTIRALLTLLILIIGGCGGGTRGTGDTRTVVAGAIFTTSGEPLADAMVTQAETGESAATDDTGAFLLPVLLFEGTATLTIERGELVADTTLIITSPPGDGGPVPVTITVDTITGIVVGVEVEPLPEPSPTPTRVPDMSTPAPEPRRGHTIEGRAITETGAPARGATFFIGNVSDTTAGGGTFRLRLPDRPAQVTMGVRYRSERGTLSLDGLPTNRAATVRVTIRLAVTEDPFTGGPPTGLISSVEVIQVLGP